MALGAQPSPSSRLVVLVTIDGLRGDYLDFDRHGLQVPNLRALGARGTVSTRTLSVFPTLTGTAHTSLVTGVRAARHGVLGNNRFDPSVWTWDRDNYDHQPPFRDFADVKARTLWAACRERGLMTAAIGWPQTWEGPIDYRLDVLVAPTQAESHARVERGASAGWLGDTESRIGAVAAVDLQGADYMKALVAADLAAHRRPAFMAVHFSRTDAVQHALGPHTNDALSALEVTDAHLGVLLDAIRRTDAWDRTTIIVTGDHGFLPLHTELAINLPLVEAGLVTKGGDGGVSWRAIVSPNRGLGSLYLARDEDQAALDVAREALERYRVTFPGRFRLLDRAAIDAQGADARARLGIEPEPGYVLDARLAGPFARPHRRAAGHGYRPDTPGMETGLILAGAGIRPGAVLPLSYTIDVAPTIAHLLGVSLPEAEGQTMAGALLR
jgi:predicted AlkP superfamily pyrophosphatase or phosphodiesterase